jgi:NodT family efflux transporter outer membrane factor (OMF) lipoprotein
VGRQARRLGSGRGWRACRHRRSQAARLNLSTGITQAYADLAYAWQLNDVAEEELTRSQKSLELTRQRRSAGIDSDLQVRQAEARVPAAQQQVQAAQQRIDAARTALAALVGKGPDRGLSIQRPQPLNPMALQLPGVLPSELLGRRPDIVAARWRVEAADKQIKVAKTKFYPSFNLTALAGVVAPNVGDLLKSSSTFAYIGPALSLPIFEGGKLRANLANTDAQYDLAVANYNQAVLDALRDVADQVNAVRSLAQQAHAAAGGGHRTLGLRPGPAALPRRHRQLPGRADRAVHPAAVAAAAGRPAVAAGADLGAPEQGAGRWFPAR